MNDFYNANKDAWTQREKETLEAMAALAETIEAEREQKAAMWEAMVEGHREYMAQVSTGELWTQAMEADKAYSAALGAEYGKNAGDIRYQTAKQTPEIRALGETYVKLSEAWMERRRQDRRDDITTPETTYSFPPRTLNW